MIILTLLVLLPFLNKAIHIDDTVRLYHARQILKSPLRPMDFHLNWYGLPQKVWEYESNPALIFYYLALIVSLFGEKEIWLHLSFLIFPVIAAVSMYYLGRRFTSSPLIAVLLLISTPAFIVMATDLMSDVPFLAISLSGVAAYIYGSDKNSRLLILLSGILVGLASLTKYVGLALVPLLMVYSLSRKRHFSETVPLICLTFGIFGMWCLQNLIYHGELHIFEAGKYLYLDRASLAGKTVGMLSYIGGATIFPLLLVCPLGWTKKNLWILIAVFPIMFGWYKLVPLAGYAVFKLLCLGIFLLVASIFCLWILGLSLRLITNLISRRRSSHPVLSLDATLADELFLLLWFWGIFYFNIITEFAAVRFVLILIPPLILLLMRLGKKKALPQKVFSIGIVLTLLLGLSVSYGDYRYANCYRNFAQEKAASFKEEGKEIWFRGHWGFQYYMEKEGFEYLAIDRMPTQGDLIIMPSIVHHEPLSKEIDEGIRLIDTVTYQTSFPIRTMHQRNKAGFYSHGYGFLPYAFSKDYLEEFKIYRYEGQT